jgi:ubiquinone/menaquinone biosynthesis C-methylase UbiE
VGFCGRLLKRIHPEGIPWPGSALYNALSRSSIFQEQYGLLVEEIAALRKDGALLDVGTGPGWLLIRLHEKCPAMRLVGVDISSAMVARARKNVAASASSSPAEAAELRRAGAAGRIQMEVGSAEKLPFADASFDLVVSSGSAHHWKDAAGALNEIHRMLRPGGRALIYDLVKVMPPDVRREAVRRFGRFRIALLWLHTFEEPFYSAEELISLARASRFRDGRTSYVGVLCRLEMVKT